ncbi:hypothetical protein [Ferrimonas sp. SCSIO 43195]|uniref:hypothetical protein n=1 Tax=Ferrimonas sp. SCSIO 43195 TaxID=2822844 RepID=UPI002074B1A5|nr:hypothetical protein [Ferrimonas sp. SCSIO 43195]USD39383.1 hypothetical protein J8Z22_09950 [Ferrimonas sp. SCSIO 43195]
MTHPKPTIAFNILNGAATQLPQLHQLSDAGAGQNLMHLTPTRDSELIANGSALTPFPSPPQPTPLTAKGLLDNGGISPAVLTRGMLNRLHQAGHNIEFRSYNFQVQCPQPGSSDWFADCQHHGGLEADCGDLIQQRLLPDLTAQAERGCISILAECGVGGTTFSTLWLRLLTGLTLSPAGSTKDADKLAQKARLLAQLEQEYRRAHAQFDVEALLASPQFHDQIQRALYGLLCHWPASLPVPHLAGGMMFVAPLIAAARVRPDLRGRVDTTRWVVAADGQSVLSHLPADWRLGLHQTDFGLSDFDCLNRYEQGLVVEGCGLGGVLVLAEELGLDANDIITTLEQACTRHQSQFQ